MPKQINVLELAHGAIAEQISNELGESLIKPDGPQH